MFQQTQNDDMVAASPFAELVEWALMHRKRISFFNTFLLVGKNLTIVAFFTQNNIAPQRSLKGYEEDGALSGGKLS